jgi:hypothetical protein
MRRLFTAVLGALALLASAGPAFAAEADLFDLLTRVCLPYPFDLPGAEAQARRMGFEPAESTQPVPLGLRDVTALERTIDGKKQYVALGRGITGAQGAFPEAETVGCVVSAPGGDAASITAGTDWLGPMKPALQVDNVTMFTYRDGPSGRAPVGIDDNSAIAAAVAATEYRIFAVASRRGATMLAIAWVRPPVQAL